ncbi:PLC-like phosphodiesterase [Durotheca rogersii]|uniref:PLC-like phosphodiesterase n=1 Tax=Durotheca rogersii TaxID=419775 RepID=UPI0022200ACB|nr:PLC-like phosphodiesterase [Durotheca rogersii]KAI5867600.1 PLC-like phosphodiesterase [Durotheca rogersii]
MCLSMRRRPAEAQIRSAAVRRRRTLTSELGTNSMKALKRAIALASFVAPTAIYFPGDETTGGKREIYLNAAIQRHLRKLYESLCRGKNTLPRECFATFLETFQGESAPGQIQSALDEHEYKFEKFLEVWWLRFGLDAQRLAPVEQKDLSKPISNYFISSSHNTYLSGNQLSGRSTADAYRRVLKRGCRCVEIDVWDGNSRSSTPEDPQESSGKPRSKPEHVRHLSGGSLHTAAVHFKEIVEEKFEQTRQMLRVDKTPASSPASKWTGAALTPPPFGREIGDPLSSPAFASLLDPERSSIRSRPSLPPDEPIVMHGYTLTAPVGFREVCQAIREVAFETTSLPIIISLEVHADREQQEVMVQIMKQEWAGLLVEKPHDTCPNDRMPRLEELLNKILVKVKKASSSLDNSTTISTLSPNLTIDDDASGSEDDRPGQPNGAKKPKVPICENLSSLAIYTHSEHFTNFESPAARIPSHIFSISESKILELASSKHHELFSHNRHFFMRAYPKGLRVDSSNFDPSRLWRKGVQMVALNWQSWDEGMMLNEAMFSGEHGWVLKPPGYRSEGLADADAEIIPHRSLDLIITVLAGQNLPLPEGTHSSNAKSLRPIVKCELHVEKAEERSAASLIEGVSKAREAEYKQRTGAGKSDHPDFSVVKNNELHFLNIQRVVEQLSFVRFKVEDDAPRLVPLKGDPFAGWACIRLDRLATGYRFVHLLDANGNKTQGVLLVRVAKSFR